jgi:hypothetical protein
MYIYVKIYGAMANEEESSRFEIILGAITASQINLLPNPT